MSVNMIAASLRVSVAVFAWPSDMAAIILLRPPRCQTADGGRLPAHRVTRRALLNAYARHLPHPRVHRLSVCGATSSEGREPAMPFVFLASQLGRRLPSDPTSRGRPCLGLVVLFTYLPSHEGEPPTEDLPPHT